MSTPLFNAASSFDTNFETFLAETEHLDAEMSAILKANREKLLEIVKHGDRDALVRSQFNAEVMAALDKLVAPPTGDKE